MPPLDVRNEEIRAQYVTASEAGALMGPHPYTTPEAIWDRLMGSNMQPRKVNEAMSLGSFMETPILRFAERRDRFRARLNARTFVHPTAPLCATPDALQVFRAGLFVPERALVEIKFGQPFGPWNANRVPPYVEWQCRAQMACTGRDTVYVYVLVGVGLEVFQLYRDPDEETRLLDRVQRFWIDNILGRVRPEPEEPRELELDFASRKGA